MAKEFELIVVPNFILDEDVKNNGGSIFTDDYRRMALSRYAIDQLKEKGISNHEKVKSTHVIITTFKGIEKVEMKKKLHEINHAG